MKEGSFRFLALNGPCVGCSIRSCSAQLLFTQVYANRQDTDLAVQLACKRFLLPKNSRCDSCKSFVVGLCP